VVRRVRPILMTTLTSLAGLLPLVLVPGSGSELYRGVGAVVLGGLALSTALTLFIVPAVFTVTWRLARRA
jgi:HAE1 family hydrophobic/amphiphilic exporter-1